MCQNAVFLGPNLIFQDSWIKSNRYLNAVFTVNYSHFEELIFDWFITHECIRFQPWCQWDIIPWIAMLNFKSSHALNALNSWNNSNITEFKLNRCCFAWLVKCSEKPNVKSRQPNEKNVYSTMGIMNGTCAERCMQKWWMATSPKYVMHVVTGTVTDSDHAMASDLQILRICDSINSQLHASQFQRQQ